MRYYTPAAESLYPCCGKPTSLLRKAYILATLRRISPPQAQHNGKSGAKQALVEIHIKYPVDTGHQLVSPGGEEPDDHP